MTATDDGRRAIDCDANAGTRCLPEVLAEFVAVEQRCPGNPASAHASGRAARGVLEAARARIAAALEIAPTDVLFTSGGTEACNLAVRGLGDPGLPALLADTEHPAVYEPALERGCRRLRMNPDASACLAPPAEPVGLLCVAHGQSEVGTLQPVDQATAIADAHHVPLFVDAAQTLGRVPLGAVVASGAVVALSPHKAGGLRGHGVLVGRALGARLRPFLRGGGQELGLRPGTQSPALAAANALAIELAVREQPRRALRMAELRAAFLAELAAADCTVQVVTPVERSLPNTVMLYFDGVDGRHLLPALDLAGVHASHGAACSSAAPTPPRVLLALSFNEADARRCVRFSFDWRDDERACRRAGERVARVIARLRKKN